MQPEYRLHILVIATTLIVMFLVLTRIVPNLDWLGTWKGGLLGGVVGYASTWGMYKFLHSLLTLALNNLRPLRWLLFREYYIEGTWVGYYYGDDGEVRYVVDRISQRIGAPISVNGYGYRGEDDQVYATWRLVAGGFHESGEEFIFGYNATILATGEQVQGITTYRFARRKYFSPSWITGHSTTVGTKRRLEINAEKLSSSDSDPIAAYLSAREFYKRTKEELKKK